jgi:hypothetical protein
MPTPTNDNFASARYIYDGIQFSDDLTGATIEANEDSTHLPGTPIGLRSIWYKWVALATTTVTVNLPVVSSQSLTIYQGGGDLVDTFDTLTLISGSIPATFTSLAGVTYYFRVSNSSGLNTFQMSFPLGVPPGSYRSPGTNDLPTALNATLHTNPRVHIVEAVGYAPESERLSSRMDLLADDQHSDSVFAATSLLVPNSDTSPAFTSERWLRLRFEPPFAAILNLRFWVNNYSPNAGWAIYYGLSPQFRKPSKALSDIAISPVPTTDPGVPNLGVDLLTGGRVQYSEWLVLQAVFIGRTPGAIQSSPLNYEFDWTEF